MEQTLNRGELNENDRKLLEKTLIKSISEMTTDDVAVIRARRAYLTAVERVTFKEILEDKIDYSEKTVSELKAICEERKIEIPENVTKKADIIALIQKSDELEK